MDNAMDETVAATPNRIEMELKPDDILIVRDNGRGIPSIRTPNSRTIGLRSHHDHAPRRRKVRQQGLRHVGRTTTAWELRW